MCCKKGENISVVRHSISTTVRTYGSKTRVCQFLPPVKRQIEGKGGCETERQFSCPVHIRLQGRQDPGFPFGGGIQADGQQCMVDKRVFKTLCDGGGETLQLLFGKRQCGDDFLMDCFIHKAADYIILHTVPHDIEPGQICPHDHGGMSAV